jgi:cobalt-precorrin 5A hydrolase
VTRALAVHAVTREGALLGRRLADALGADLLVAEAFAAGVGATRAFPLPMRDAVSGAFHAYAGHVFVLAAGATVRLVAPLLRDKRSDPAVVCIDEAGRFAVSLLSGHRGGANALAEEVARASGAVPVVTTASDVQGTLAVDLLGRDLGFAFEDPRGNATRAAAAVVNGDPVLVVQEAGARGWWPAGEPLPANVTVAPALDAVAAARFAAILVISDRAPLPEAVLARAVVYRPPTLAVGVGCDRGAPAAAVERALDAALAAGGLARGSVARVASIDVKGDEAGILALAARVGAPLRLFTAAALDAAPGIERPSETVRRRVGTRGVSEPAALLAARATRLLVPKQVHRDAASGKSVTVAIARIAKEAP